MTGTLLGGRRASRRHDLDDQNDAPGTLGSVSHSDFLDDRTQCMVLSAIIAIPAVGGTPEGTGSAWTVPTRRFAMF